MKLFGTSAGYLKTKVTKLRGLEWTRNGELDLDEFAGCIAT